MVRFLMIVVLGLIIGTTMFRAVVGVTASYTKDKEDFIESLEKAKEGFLKMNFNIQQITKVLNYVMIILMIFLISIS